MRGFGNQMRGKDGGAVGKAGISHCNTAPLKPLGDFERAAVAKKRNTFTALGNQMFGRNPPTKTVVGADRTMRKLRPVTAPDDQRAIPRGDPVENIGLIRLADNHDAIDAARINNPVEPASI